MTPLAERMRPKTLDELRGQQHLTGRGSIFISALGSGRIPSMILWGPPGSGKTTMAHIIAHSLKVPFHTLSAISSGVKEVREVIEISRKQEGSILFIDEIHRFNKGQQDALLGAVEKGIITLIGATTENPSFEVNSALLSRCQVYVLRPLSEEELISVLYAALQKDELLNNLNIELKETKALLSISGGDARKMLNLLELVVNTAMPDATAHFEKEDAGSMITNREPNDQTTTRIAPGEQVPNLEKSLVITDELVMTIAQQKIALYDKKGEQHYDIISAFIKSIRGSDPNAALYWLARMIEGGEDVKFIARRMLILASEDIGNANPTALVMANTCFEAVNKIGYPESALILSQCAIYLASSSKSNSATTAIGQALHAVKEYGDLSVPLNIRNAPTALMKKMGYGKNYEYSHSFENHFSPQEYLPKEISGMKFYEPGSNSREEELRKYLKNLWKNKYGY